MSAYSKLSRQRQIFVDEFVRTGVVSDSYSVAFPNAKRPDVGGSKMLVWPQVRQAVEERKEQAIARAGVRHVRVMEEIAAIAFSDLGEFFTDDGQLKPLSEIPKASRAALQGLDVEELFEGSGENRRPSGYLRKVRTHSKVEALKLLGQHLKLFVERHEHTGKDGGAIETKDVSELSDLDRARRVAFLLARGLQLQQSASAPDPGNPAGDSPPAQSNQQEIPI